MILKKYLIVALLAVCSLSAVFAVDGITHQTFWGAEFAYYLDSNEGQNQDKFEFPSYSPTSLPGDYTAIGGDEGRKLGSGWGAIELQLYAGHKVTVPFLQGSGPLTSNNNVSFQVKGYLAPVVAYIETSATIEPLAFLNFSAGYSIGTGWYGLGFNGIGLNNDGTGVPEQKAFPGAAMETWASGTFQFDVAALWPGDWHHIVMVADAKINYINFTAAGNNDAWQWKADKGENFNGLLYEGTYLLGYQMPKMVDTVGFLVETTQRVGSASEISKGDTADWNSSWVHVKFGPLMNLSFNEKNSLTILLQLENQKKYTDDTIYYNYFRNREYESDYFRIHRLALSYKHIIK